LTAVARTGPSLAWVTGATSFLGRHVARALAASGCTVVGLARADAPGSIATDWGFRAMESGPFEPALLERVLVRFGAPQLVFHAIGSGSVGQALADPKADVARTLGTLATLGDVLRNLGPKPRLIYPSSAAVYGDAGAAPTAETAATSPVSVYGQSKLTAEEFCQRCASEDGLEIVIMRLFSLFGAPQRKLLFWDLGRRILSGETVITLGGSGTETRDFIHVKDAARAVAMLAAARNPPPLVNVGSGHATAIREVTAAFASTLGVAVPIEFSGVTRPGDPLHQQANIALLRTIGFEPQVELDAGLAEYAAWLRGIGPAAES
jgi:UDP-glucose 4-epimerase